MRPFSDNLQGDELRINIIPQQNKAKSSVRPYSNVNSKRRSIASMPPRKNQDLNVKTNKRAKEKIGSRNHRFYQNVGTSRCSELEEEIEDFVNDQCRIIDTNPASCKSIETTTGGDDSNITRRNIRNWISGLDDSAALNAKSLSSRAAEKRPKKYPEKIFSQRDEPSGASLACDYILTTSMLLEDTETVPTPQTDRQRNGLNIDDEIGEFSDGNDNSMLESSSSVQDDSRRVFPSFLDKLDITDISTSLQPLRSRKRSRSKGELGQCLNRFLIRTEQENALFKHVNQNHGDDLNTSADREFFCAHVQSLSFEMNLVRVESTLCHDCDDVKKLTIFLLFPKNVWKDLGFGQGHIVKVSMPWHAFATTSGKYILCSEKCISIGVEALNTISDPLQQVAEKILCDANSTSTVNFSKFCNLDTFYPEGREFQRLHFGNFEALNLEDLGDGEGSNRITCISNVHPFMVDLSVAGQIIAIHPRHLLISRAALGDVDSCYRGLLAKTNYSDLSFLQPGIVIMDNTETCTINIPVPFVNKWMEPLLSADVCSTFEFHCLSISPDVKLRNNSTLAQSCDKTETPLQLVVTEKSYFYKVETPKEHQTSDLISGAVKLSSVSEINVRVKILLVQLMEVLTLPNPTKFHLWLSVREKSMKETGVPNVLAYITDACQVLACQSVLKQGDVLLIRNAIVVSSSCCENSVPHSNSVCINIDSLSQIVKVGSNKELRYEESESQFILPYCYVRKSLLEEFEQALGLHCDFENSGGSYLRFEGKIAEIDAIKVSRICPECRSSNCFREIELPDETSRMNSCLCLECGFVDHRPACHDIECCHVIVRTTDGKDIDFCLDNVPITQLLASLSDATNPAIESLLHRSVEGTGFWWCTVCAEGLQDGMQLQVVNISLR